MAQVTLTLTVPKLAENTPEQTAQLLASLARATYHPNWANKLLGKTPVTLTLQVAWINQQIQFFITCPQSLENFVRSQVSATYPDVVIIESSPPKVGEYAMTVKQFAPAYFPLRDYADYKVVDPMVPLLGVLAKAAPDDHIVVQFTLSPAPKKVLAAAHRYLAQEFELAPDGKPIRALPPEEKAIIKDKISHPLVGVRITFFASRQQILTDLMGAISVLNRPDGNSLVPNKSKIFKKPLCVLNTLELSSLWHLPGAQTKLPNIAWAPSVVATEAPTELPTEGEVNYFASTTHHNKPTKFGILLEDRLRHMYILGKSGTGKSTLLENMAVDDFKKGRGVAFIDPHGDSVENLLNYIPSARINDTIYFNPADREHPIAINILEITQPDQAELVVSGIISIFHKLYGKFWGPRMQYIFRNALLTLTELPNSTLPDVIKILSDQQFRTSVYPKIKNKSLLNFWRKEFDNLEDETRLQYTYPILNKVGQFVNSPLIQGVISQPKSSIDVAQIMNSGKIFLANLSQGKLGEDNAALLGAILITKFELAALARIDQAVPDRQNFFLYVDEFQNFATTSFIKILSEARKFHLGLILANQYVAQIPEDIQKAIFGNVGTIAAFNLGAEDARVLSREFSPVFDEASLLNLQQYQIALKMTIHGGLTAPFTAFSLPPLKSKNLGKTKVVSESRRRYSVPTPTH